MGPAVNDDDNNEDGGEMIIMKIAGRWENKNKKSRHINHKKSRLILPISAADDRHNNNDVDYDSNKDGDNNKRHIMFKILMI